MVCFTLVLLQHLVISVFSVSWLMDVSGNFFYFDVDLVMPLLVFFRDCILI